jgi:hypothetical protein
LVRHLEGLGIQTAVTFLTDASDKNLGYFENIFLSVASAPNYIALHILQAVTFSTSIEKTLTKNYPWQSFPSKIPFEKLNGGGSGSLGNTICL